MKANPDKCNFLSSHDMNIKISVKSFDIENPHSRKLLGVTIDRKLNYRKLNFHDHVSNLCEKKSAQISAISAFKSKETDNQSHFNVLIWLLLVGMDDSRQNFK